MMKVLIACEYSGIVREAFKKKGHDAWSCDLLPTEIEGQHIKANVLDVLYNDEVSFYGVPKHWDLMIAHPPCTMIAGSSVQWLSHPEDKHLPFDDRRPHPKYPNRRTDMLESIEFVKKLYNCYIEKVCIENPVGVLGTRWKKSDQIIQPYQFGDEATKTTCLWLKNLPPLKHTKLVGKGERIVFTSGKSHPKWYAEALSKAKTKQERQTLRSKTFQGIANAIAEQWSVKINNNQMKIF